MPRNIIVSEIGLRGRAKSSKSPRQYRGMAELRLATSVMGRAWTVTLGGKQTIFPLASETMVKAPYVALSLISTVIALFGIYARRPAVAPREVDA